MFKELRRRLDEQSEKLEFFNRVRKYKEEPEINSTITEMKNALEGKISILNDEKEQISKLEDKIVEITEAEQQ